MGCGLGLKVYVLGIGVSRLGEKGLRFGAYRDEALNARGGGCRELHLFVVQRFRVRLLMRENLF